MLGLQATVLCVVVVYLLQDLVDSCAREGEEDSGGLVLWDSTSRGLCVFMHVCMYACMHIYCTRRFHVYTYVRVCSVCL
jgi:hypothetical protein